MNDTDAAPVILPRAEHGISRSRIDDETLKVLYRLHQNGHLAYLVGGGVRDLLLGRQPKDFDVGTDATPEQVKKLFRNCWLVGRRFRLAHVRFGRDKVVEVATLRRQPEEHELPENPDDHFHYVQNVYGNPREDAFRRDFTINALFYNIADFTVIDYVGGLEDIRARRLRVIGDPRVRFTEDPVRMLRALEFTARLDFTLDAQAQAAIGEKAPLLLTAAPARVRDEIHELFRHAVAAPVLRSCRETGLLPYLIPDYRIDEPTLALLTQADARTAEGHPPAESDTLALLYLAHFLEACPPTAQGNLLDAVHLAGEVLNPHTHHFHLAAGIRAQALERMVGVWRLLRGRGFRGEKRFVRHPGFRAALTLLAEWCRATGTCGDLLEQWQKPATDGDRDAPRRSPAVAEGGESGAPPARKRRRRRRRRGKAPAAGASA